ncbi:Adenylate kinase domain-containing protein [Phytophthora infestans]|uniref:Adenylate kinase domain-containing protein n=1 Tax=Phytophthora infestans TaxID=4787 RepID=A0A8S9UIT6_PHYIN|nr:Adenylate kinase domain-containing protein [Phytophthora infestans]
MAELLLRWLNHELELSSRVTDVESDFSSGYLLGEILHRLNHQHNFADFMRSSSADAKVVNFCLLEPALHKLNVKFDANVAVATMNEKKDAAANLLYQIKMAAARVGRAPNVSTKSLERTGIIPLHNRPVKLAKPIYDSEKHKLFEHSIRRHVRSSTSLQQEKDQIANETKKREAYLASMAEQREILDNTKAERLHRAYIHSSYIKEAFEETDSPAWRLALQKKNACEQRRVAFLQQLMKKREEADENLTFSLRRKVCNELDDFDTQDRSKAGMAGSKVSSRKSVGYGLRSLTTALNVSSDKQKYSNAHLAGSAMNEAELYQANMLEMEDASGVIKQQRALRGRRKDKLSRRRKRFVQDCVNTHSLIGTARVASILENLVLRDTNSENDIQHEMDRILVYKEIARENRSMRNQEYSNQQEVDSMTAMDRDTSCYHNLLLQFEDNSEMQILQRNDVQQSIEAAERFLSEQISSTIMQEMVAFVLFIAGKREETLHSRDPAVFLTTETWNEYKIKFANGCNFEEMTSWSASVKPSQAELLDIQELEQYLSSFLPFHTKLDQEAPLSIINDGFLFPGATEAIQDCFVLGEEIKTLRWISRSLPLVESHELDETNVAPCLPGSNGPVTRSHQQLRILIFGPAFSGKETQARLLGESHNLTVLSVHDLIQCSVKNSSGTGVEVNDLLVNGEQIPLELYSRLILEAIRGIEQSFSLHVDGKSKAGWVIYDLPATAQHGQSLEEHLTGYKDPADTSSPYDFESSIAPGRSKPPLTPTFLHGKSGVDLVFHFDCPAGTVLDRCLGRVEDVTTGDTRHLVFDPPSDDSTERHRLQHVNSSAYSSELLSLHCWASDEFMHDHKAWYTKFNTLDEPSKTGMTADEVHGAVTSVVDRLLKERKYEAESKQLQQEAGEQALMSTEEERQRRMDAFESELDEAKISVIKVEASIAEVEEAKAKKEETAELRQKLEGAHRQLDGIKTAVKSWMEDEISSRPVPSNKYSGELVPATAQALAALWDEMETEYISTMKETFAQLREQRHRVTDRAQQMTSEYCEFVRRSDRKQEVVNQFQRQFNEVVDEMRFEDPTKVELHSRADILQDELGSLLETKASENDEELNSMVGDGWTEDTCQQVAAIYQMALQAEWDRFRTSVQVLVNGHYAASSDCSALSGIMEVWQSHQARLEQACRVYRDPANITPVETPLVSVAAAKAAPKGKAKAPAAAIVAPSNVAATNEDALAEALTMTELLAEYGHVLQRCSSWMEAIALIANPAAEKGGEAGDTQKKDGDCCKVNLLTGIKYEHDLMERRVRFLRESTQNSSDGITRSMRSIEITLRDFSEDRRVREQAAVAAVIEYIRVAVENEVALSSFIDVSPEFVERFPATVQLRQDTLVRVDEGKRLLPQAPPDTSPLVEESHELLLNPRQRDSLQEALASQTTDDSGLVPLITVVETMTALTSLPDALPDVWRLCPAHIIAEIAAKFTMKRAGFVDIEALLTAMSTRDDLLCQLQQEEQLKLQEQQPMFEQQQETSDNEPVSTESAA